MHPDYRFSLLAGHTCHHHLAHPWFKLYASSAHCIFHTRCIALVVVGPSYLKSNRSGNQLLAFIPEESNNGSASAVDTPGSNL